MISVLLQISAEGPLTDVVEVNSCVVSPLSDPKKSPFWSVINDGCSSDASLVLEAKPKDEEDEETEGDSKKEEEDIEGMEKGRIYHRDGDVSPHHKVERREAAARRAEEKIQPLRFSFILRPVYNDSMQFLHCSLRLCISDSPTGDSMKETETNDCQGGLHIPPLLSKSPGHQVQKQKPH